MTDDVRDISVVVDNGDLNETGSELSLAETFFALLVTNVGAPPFTFVAGALIVGASVERIGIAQFISLLGGLAPLGVLILLKAFGGIKSLDLDSAKERFYGFSLAIFFALVAYLLLTPQDTPAIFFQYLEAHILATTGLFILTIFTLRYNWKVSIHSASAACLAFLGVYFDVPYALLWGSLSLILISWSRYVLNKHTMAQIVIGALLGFIVYSGYFLIFL